MSGTTGIRWYRHGGSRLLASIMISFLGIVPAGLIIYGLGHPLRWLFIVPGAVLAVGIAVWVRVPLRAGIGVTPEHLLIRTATGSTTTVPWPQVTGFEGGKEGPKSWGKDRVFVLTSAGKRLHTAGYATAGTVPAELWRLLRVLEDERLARTPGAVSTLPPAPPSSEPGEVDVAPVFAVLGVIALLVLGTWILTSGVTGLGPGLRAASGAGTAGYFIPQRETTGKGTLWFGEFRLPDGTVLRRDTFINDLSKGSMHTGVPVPARDVGGSDGVYPRDDPGAWHNPAGLLTVATWCYAATLVVTIRAGIRRLRRDRHNDDGNVATSPQAAGHPDLRTTGCGRPARV